MSHLQSDTWNPLAILKPNFKGEHYIVYIDDRGYDLEGVGFWTGREFTRTSSHGFKIKNVKLWKAK